MALICHEFSYNTPACQQASKIWRKWQRHSLLSTSVRYLFNHSLYILILVTSYISPSKVVLCPLAGSSIRPWCDISLAFSSVKYSPYSTLTPWYTWYPHWSIFLYANPWLPYLTRWVWWISHSIYCMHMCTSISCSWAVCYSYQLFLVEELVVCYSKLIWGLISDQGIVNNLLYYAPHWVINHKQLSSS